MAESEYEPVPPWTGTLDQQSRQHRREDLMTLAIAIAVLVVVILAVLAEVVSAVLPIVIVLTMVPPEERHGLAELLAAADSSRKLRLWSALRVAVLARRVRRPATAPTRETVASGSPYQR
jgi:putative exporter of polyketide antibiotics